MRGVLHTKSLFMHSKHTGASVAEESQWIMCTLMLICEICFCFLFDCCSSDLQQHSFSSFKNTQTLSRFINEATTNTKKKPELLMNFFSLNTLPG